MKRGVAEPIEDVRNIAVLKPSAIGDFVFSLPALDALKLAYPGAHLVYIGKRWHAEFLHGRPGPVDEVVELPRCPGVGAPAGDAGQGNDSGGVQRGDEGGILDSFIDAMQRRRFDLALQLYGGGRYANPLIRRLGARVTVGLKARDAEPLDRWLPYADAVNRRLHLLEVAALAGAQAWPMGGRLHIIDRDRHAAAKLLPARGGKPLVLIQPGASDARRRWPAARFAVLADLLAGEGAVIALNGTKCEMPLVHSIAASMRYPAIDLSGCTSLSALCGVLERCALVVSNDTGPLHLALALGTPAVGIYWFTNLIESAPLLQGAHRAAVSLQVHCPVCGVENVRARCVHDVSFVDSVPLEEVAGLALELLGSE